MADYWRRDTLANTSAKFVKMTSMHADPRIRVVSGNGAMVLLLMAVAAVMPEPSRASADADTRGHSNLILVVDGLRPDYISAEIMPNLQALGERGVSGEVHSAAFPSVTRVNSATVSSGSYPVRHGLMHNTMFLRGFSDAAFSTARAGELRKLRAYSRGRLLDVPTLGALLDERGLELFITGSGGSGTSLLQNPAAGSGMSIWTAGGFFVPQNARARAVAAVGEPPDDDSRRTIWAFNACLYRLADEHPPDAVTMWIHEVDGAGHSYGVGAPETLQAASNVDAQIGRIVDALDKRGLRDRVNIFVTSDHGFSTNSGGFSVARALRKEGFGADDVKVVREMIFLARQDPALLEKVVTTLQRDPHVGNVYTRPARPGSGQGIVPGTLSTTAIWWDHDRAADVLASPTWNHEANEHGFPGTSTRGGKSPASHGSDSPYDLQIRLVAAGPDIKRGIRSRVPTGNVDLAPTVLHLLGIEPPSGMNGRVLHELLRDGPSPDQVAVDEHTYRADVVLEDGLRYEARLDTVKVGSTVYLRGAKTNRSHSSRP